MSSVSDPADPAELTEWIRAYPQFKRELMEFAALWAVADYLPAQEVTASDELEVPTSDSCGARLEELLRKKREERDAREVPLSGILEEAERRGLSVVELAEEADLSITLVMMLDQRLLVFSSIPRKVIAGLAGAIKRSVDSVAAYLQGAAIDPFGPDAKPAFFYCESAPQSPSQQDFSDAVRSDLTLSEEHRRRLLAITQEDE